MVERLKGIQEVRGSNPLGSTILRSEPTLGGSERRMVSSIASAKEDFLVTNSELRMAGHPEKIRMIYYTYIIESISHPENRYIGHTSDLKQRVAEHNAGRCDHTAKMQASNFADNQRRSGLRLGKPAFQSTECRLPRRNAVKAGPQPMSFKTFQTSTRQGRRPGRIGFGSARHQGVADTKFSSVSGQQPA